MMAMMMIKDHSNGLDISGQQLGGKRNIEKREPESGLWRLARPLVQYLAFVDGKHLKSGLILKDIITTHVTSPRNEDIG